MDRKLRRIIAFIAILSLLFLCGCRRGNETETTEGTEDTTVQDTTEAGIADGTTGPENGEEVPSEGNTENTGSTEGGSNNGGSGNNGSINNGGSGNTGSNNGNVVVEPTIDESLFEGPIDVVDPEDVVEVTTPSNNGSTEKPTVGNDPTEGSSTTKPTEPATSKPSGNTSTTEGSTSTTAPNVTEPTPTEPAPTTTEKPTQEPTTGKNSNGAIELPMIPG